MRLVLRRLLWLGPTLLLITLVAFGLLSSALPAEPELRELPLFFNPEPGALERLSVRALRQIVEAPEPPPEAERTLARLGGAALPFVLPALDAFSPAQRGRAVRALRPVAARMGLEIDESWDASREVLLWTRFWEEHSIDYRPSVARRAVLRLGQRSTVLRDTEVRQLDTYALDELIAQMPPEGPADLERTSRLTQIAADMTGQRELGLPASAGQAEAERSVAAWQDWWARYRNQYKVYTGTERIAAMLRDTRYGAWVSQAVRRKLGVSRAGEPVWDVLRAGAGVTFALFSAGLLGVWMGGMLGGVLGSLGGAGVRRRLGGVGLLRAALPVLLLAVLAARWLGPGAQQLWLGVLLMWLGGAPPGWAEGARDAARPSGDFSRTLAALGVAPWRAGLVTMRMSSARLLAHLGAHLSNLLTMACVLEHVLGLPGLGNETVGALLHPDLNWLMTITIGAALFAGLWHVFGEWLSSLLDPRWASAPDLAGGSS